MNTPAHLIFGAAAFARAGRPGVTAAALVGALLPDLSLYLMTIWHLQVVGTSPQVVFDQLYFSEEWMRVFRVDNSFVLWGLALVVALATRRAWALALCGAALLHIAFDFPLHHDDGRPHFWPLTMWIYESPVSYWDRSAHAGIVEPIEIAICLALCVVLWRRFSGAIARVLVALAAALQIAPIILWRIVFAL